MEPDDATVAADEVEEVRPGLLTRLADDDTTQRRVAVLCLFSAVLAAAGGGAAWHHLPAVLACWCGAGGLLLAAFVLGWEPAGPPEPTTVAYYEGGAFPPLAPPEVLAPQPMRQPAPWGNGRRAG